MRVANAVCATALLAGCAADADNEASDGVQDQTTAGEPAQASVECSARGPTLVSLSTQDGLVLEADFHGAGIEAGPAVVLLHMIPPSNDKSNFPPAFITALTDAGFSVLNVNRRGAGNSQGDPMEAYVGANGRLDAVAAVRFVTEDGCHANADAVAFVAASNGTTTAIDYALGSSNDLPAMAVALLSPGGYTENQHDVAAEAATLSPLPILFAYPDAERDWPQSIAALDSGRWEFREYADGRHGAGLFGSNPEVIGDIVDFLARARG